MTRQPRHENRPSTNSPKLRTGSRGSVVGKGSLPRRLRFEPLEDRRMLAAGLTLLKDIVAGGGSSNPDEFVAVGDTTYFSANGQLWVTEGTGDTTHSIADFSPTWLTSFNGKLFFSGGSNSSGAELCVSDGTTAGTVVLKNIVPSSGSSNPSDFKVSGNYLYFEAADSTGDRELWRTDGTETGTFRLKDITPGAAGNSVVSQTDVNGTLYFVANNGTNGSEIWKTHGIAEDPVMIETVVGPGTLSPGSLTTVGDTLFFTAQGNLWKLDPATDAMTMVVDTANTPTLLTKVGNQLFYFDNGGASLWKTDGNTASQIKAFNGPGHGSYPQPVAIGNQLLFAADHNNSGFELYVSDGTPAGTVLVKDINPSSGDSSPSDMVAVGRTLYFTALDDTHGRELWRTDGTLEGTTIVADLVNGPGTSTPIAYMGAFGRLYVGARGDGVGREPWLGPATESPAVWPARPVRDISPGSSSPSNFANVSGTLFFRAADEVNGRELWKSDGTEAGTVLVKDIRSGPESSTPEFLTPLGDKLVFLSDDGIHGDELWMSDGTEAGTHLIKDLGSGLSSLYPEKFVVIGNWLYFSASSETGFGDALWKTDGTEAGTVIVRDFVAFDINSLTRVSNTLYFTATDEIHGSELWRSDGSTNGTVLVKDILAGTGDSLPGNLTDVNGMLYLLASDENENVGLWKSDGTEAGTELVKQIWIGPGNPATALEQSQSEFINVNGTLFFTANGGGTGLELWKSNGTTSGTVLVKDIWLGPNSGAHNLFAFKGKLYFAANPGDGIHGLELWTSDGTEAGTFQLKDLEPSGSSSPGDFVGAGDVFYFVADHGNNPGAVWRSDGTARGTQLAAYFTQYIGGGTSYINDLVPIDDQLYLDADDLVYHEEVRLVGSRLRIPLSESGTGIEAYTSFNVTDLDDNDRIGASIQSVSISGNVSGLTKTNAEVLAMMSVDVPTVDLDSLQVAQVAVSFNSGSETFSYLALGETLKLSFVVKFSDSFGNSNEQTVVLEIGGSGPALAGDYNQNSAIEAGDYVLWRKTTGTAGVAAYSGADGSGNGSVGPEDYGVWRANFGATLPPGAGTGATALSIGEPTVELGGEAGSLPAQTLVKTVDSRVAAAGTQFAIFEAAAAQQEIATRPRLQSNVSSAVATANEELLLALAVDRFARHLQQDYSEFDDGWSEDQFDENMSSATSIDDPLTLALAEW